MGTRTLHDQIANATNRLAKLKAREMLAEQRAKTKAKSEARRADAHRKIELGGLVIAAGVADMDPAELVGALLTYERKATDSPGVRDQVKAKGVAHLAERETVRNANRKG